MRLRYEVMDYTGKRIAMLYNMNEVKDYVKDHKYVYVYSYQKRRTIYDGFSGEGFEEE